MTAPISNGPTTTRLHHYAGHYCLWAPQLDFSGPSGALHTSDAWRAVCCQARRCDSGQALPPPTGTAALSARLLWV